jgi:hypothetical protein
MTEPITIGMLTFQAISCILHSWAIKNSNCSITDCCGCLNMNIGVEQNRNAPGTQEMTESAVR